MKITRVDITPFCIPYRRPLVLAGVPVHARRGLLVRVVADGGAIGVGEASPHPGALQGVLDAVEQAVRATGPALVGVAADLPELLHHLRGVEPAPARAALEMCVYDLAGQLTGQRLAELLGTTQRERVEVNALLDHSDPVEASAAARAAAADGFRCLKLKLIPNDLDGTLARMRAVRAAVGQAMRLRLDANAAWTVPDAVRAISRLAAHGPEYIEQPVATVEDMAAVRRAVEVPIAADESIVDEAAVHRIAAAQAADIVVVKPALLGLQEAMAVAQAARAYGLGVVVTSAMDTSIGIAAALHLAATLPDPLPACGLATASLLARDLVREPLIPKDGVLGVPGGPGLGVAIDQSALQRLSLSRHGASGP